MAKVKFNTKTLDKDTGVTYDPANEFVDVSEQFAKRIKDLQASDPRHKDSYEFEQVKEVKSKKADKQDD